MKYIYVATQLLCSFHCTTIRQYIIAIHIVTIAPNIIVVTHQPYRDDYSNNINYW